MVELAHVIKIINIPASNDIIFQMWKVSPVNIVEMYLPFAIYGLWLYNQNDSWVLHVPAVGSKPIVLVCSVYLSIIT